MSIMSGYLWELPLCTDNRLCKNVHGRAVHHGGKTRNHPNSHPPLVKGVYTHVAEYYTKQIACCLHALREPHKRNVEGKGPNVDEYIL